MTTQTRLHSALAGITAAMAALRDPLPDADAATVGPHLAGLGTLLAAVRARLEKAIEAVEPPAPKQETSHG